MTNPVTNIKKTKKRSCKPPSCLDKTHRPLFELAPASKKVALRNKLIRQLHDVMANIPHKDEDTLDITMTALVGINPGDELEGMLATQMLAVHTMAMEMSRRSLLDGQTTDGINNNINRVTKLMRTYTSQIEALNKYRTKGQQKITVQHVNVNDGGQAVIGDVKQGDG